MRCLARRFTTVLTGLALGGAVSGPAIAGAQVGREAWPPAISSLRPGDTVRVWASVPPLAGTVAALADVTDDSLRLRDLAGRPSLPAGAAIALAAVRRLDVRRGQRRSPGWAVLGVVLGVAGGAVAGALTGVFIECGTSCSDESTDFAGLAGIVLGGGLGAITGAVVGGVLGARRRPHWEPVALPAR